MPHRDLKNGDRVVCIADSVSRVNDLGMPGFRKGQVFTIASMEWHEPFGLFLGFEERDCRIIGHVDGFRKIQPRATDISVFEAMLHGADQKVSA